MALTTINRNRMPALLPASQVAQSTDAGATVGPTLDLDRFSASPAASDVIGSIDFNGRDSGGNKTLFGRLGVQIMDPTDGSEDSAAYINVMKAGSAITMLSIGAVADEVSLPRGNLKFPSAANPSTDANVLDDYEEGTWTPSDQSGQGLTFTSPVGTYTKVGREVFVRGSFTYPVGGSGAAARVGVLPFTTLAGQGARAGSISYSNESTAKYWQTDSAAITGYFYDAAGATIANSVMDGNLFYIQAFYPI